MPYSRLQLRTMLRDSLLDTGATLWADAAMDQCILQAVARHSSELPRLFVSVLDVAGGQTDFAPIPEAASEILWLVSVECPPGSPLPAYGWASNPPQPGEPSLTGEDWRYRIGHIQFRVPASGAQVGTGKLVVTSLQSYVRPDDSGNNWNGLEADLPLLLLLAQRCAYQMLAGWLNTIAGTTGYLVGAANALRQDPLVTIASLTVLITEELAARHARAAATPPIPVGL